MMERHLARTRKAKRPRKMPENEMDPTETPTRAMKRCGEPIARSSTTAGRGGSLLEI